MNMKSLVFLYILVLCTACASQGLPVAAPSSTSIATTRPASTSFPAPTTTPALLLPSPTPIFEVVIDNVATGRQGQLYASGFGTLGDDVRHFAQWDGTKWIALGKGFQAAGNVLAVDSASHLYTEILTDSEPGRATAIMRWDGVRWEDVTGNFTTVVDALQAGRVSSNIPVWALAVDGKDNLYAAGMFYYPTADYSQELPVGFVAKWNQETWTVLGQGFDQVNIFSLAVSAEGKVYVSGEQPRLPEGEFTINGFIARWDGETWSQIGTSKLNSCLNTRSLAVDQAGGLYASCMWSEAGELIFHWDGTDWTAITDQLEGEAPAVYDMTVDKNGHLYIGGSFEAVSGIPARNIAYWDGNSWHALGGGINERVNALAFDPGGDLYAVGFFTEAGDVPADHAARWDGETWHALVP